VILPLRCHLSWPHPAFCGLHLARDRQVGAELYVRLSMSLHKWGQMHVTLKTKAGSRGYTTIPILLPV
jgi:hypothetical protein